MKTRPLFFALFTLFLAVLSPAFAQTKTTDGVVAKITGSATVTLPSGVAVPVTAGMSIPQGATITTAADGEILLQTHTNTAATIKANSTVAVDELSVTTSSGKVTEEKTTLNLKSGNLISALDPAKRAVNNYQVRTPKGVAAARGTTFSVVVNGTTYTVTTTSGGVAFTRSDGNGGTVTIAAGQVSSSETNSGTPVSIADMPAGTAKDAAVAEMTNVLAAVAVAATVGVVPASELQAAVTNVITAAPESATTIAQTVATVAPSQAATITNAVNAVPDSVLSQSAKTEAGTAVTTGAATGTATNTTTTTTTTTGTKTEVRTTTPIPIDVTITSPSQ